MLSPLLFIAKQANNLTWNVNFDIGSVYDELNSRLKASQTECETQKSKEKEVSIAFKTNKLKNGCYLVNFL